ncbi:hypothetical protein RYX56_15350 [Alkalihalophilus lindianensis]|uniref:Uncharacterized protein n=1 Tax=Alkalihalophilus lindianensis TaxID=1630542 RepID=A0ABU3XCX9_9BACI|nr:hypothetical protein [Alkalihalophilus lindianensis]MDV2685741.1 hypothetical protein [Alkalihalophilus lindianensis]
MYDPTIFENLKVAIENHIYDLDNLDQIIQIHNRVDRLEMAVMAREFALRFSLRERSKLQVEINLVASVKDLAAEILESDDQTIGCELKVKFFLEVEDVDRQCREIEETLTEIWKPELEQSIKQKLEFYYQEQGSSYHNTVIITFPTKINEEQMEQLPEFIDHVLVSLKQLQAIK